jgi:DNA-binding transcriptional regulator LsrR (DeoR family)
MNKEQQQTFLYDKIRALLSKGYTQREIASELHLSLGKINQVVQLLKQQARVSLSHYVTTTLPEEMELSIVRLDNMLKQLHADLDDKTTSKRDRHNAMALINQCTQLKLDILGAGVLTNQLQSQSNNNNQQSNQEARDNNETNTVS